MSWCLSCQEKEPIFVNHSLALVYVLDLTWFRLTSVQTTLSTTAQHSNVRDKHYGGSECMTYSS